MDSESDSNDVLLLATTALALAACVRRPRGRAGRGRRGSVVGRVRNRERGRISEAGRIDALFFCRGIAKVLPGFNDVEFARRFCLPRDVFERVRTAVCADDPFFEQRADALGILGATTDQKLIAALRFLTTGTSCDSIVDTVCISESTVYVIVKRFCRSVVRALGGEYLRLPNDFELREIERR